MSVKQNMIEPLGFLHCFDCVGLVAERASCRLHQHQIIPYTGAGSPRLSWWEKGHKMGVGVVIESF